MIKRSNVRFDINIRRLFSFTNVVNHLTQSRIAFSIVVDRANGSFGLREANEKKRISHIKWSGAVVSWISSGRHKASNILQKGDLHENVVDEMSNSEDRSSRSSSDSELSSPPDPWYSTVCVSDNGWVRMLGGEFSSETQATIQISVQILLCLGSSSS